MTKRVIRIGAIEKVYALVYSSAGYKRGRNRFVCQSL